jgi:hypothetical protein
MSHKAKVTQDLEQNNAVFLAFLSVGLGGTIGAGIIGAEVSRVVDIQMIRLNQRREAVKLGIGW